MRITAFNGAMRGRRSITNKLVQVFLEGARSEGAETENVFLVQKRIKHCLGCLACWLKTPGKCVQKDDMAELLDLYLASDMVVIATPVYVDNVTGLMKDFIDRLVPVTDPRFEPDEDGETRHLKRYDRYPGIIALSSCGFPEQSHFQVLGLLFKRIARNMNAELVAEIYRGAAGLLEADDPGLASIVGPYMDLLRGAGAEIARTGKLSQQTAGELDRQWVPTELYNEQVNKVWERLMPKRAGR